MRLNVTLLCVAVLTGCSSSPTAPGGTPNPSSVAVSFQTVIGRINGGGGGSGSVDARVMPSISGEFLDMSFSLLSADMVVIQKVVQSEPVRVSKEQAFRMQLAVPDGAQARTAQLIGAFRAETGVVYPISQSINLR